MAQQPLVDIPETYGMMFVLRTPGNRSRNSVWQRPFRQFLSDTRQNISGMPAAVVCDEQDEGPESSRLQLMLIITVAFHTGKAVFNTVFNERLQDKGRDLQIHKFAGNITVDI